jgi:hypothetical protein
LTLCKRTSRLSSSSIYLSYVNTPNACNEGCLTTLTCQCVNVSCCSFQITPGTLSHCGNGSSDRTWPASRSSQVASHCLLQPVDVLLALSDCLGIQLTLYLATIDPYHRLKIHMKKEDMLQEDDNESRTIQITTDSRALQGTTGCLVRGSQASLQRSVTSHQSTSTIDGVGVHGCA